MLLPRVLFQFKFWGVEQNLIPYVRQMELAYIFIKGWIIDPYVSINLFHSLGCRGYVYTYFSSNLVRNILAYEGANFVPIAVPGSWL